MSVLMSQNEPAEIALQSGVVRTRQGKTIPRNTFRYSHGSLGHSRQRGGETDSCTLFRMCADYNCNSDKFLAELPIFLDGETCCVDAHTVCAQS